NPRSRYQFPLLALCRHVPPLLSLSVALLCPRLLHPPLCLHHCLPFGIASLSRPCLLPPLPELWYRGHAYDIMQEWYFLPADRLGRWRGVQILAVEHGSDGGAVHSSLGKCIVTKLEPLRFYSYNQKLFRHF
ncbi:hypothetical protein BGW80DRAFT_1412698, partial [Lactifluus volemus]